MKGYFRNSFIFCLCFFSLFRVIAQNTYIVILNEDEQIRLRQLSKNDVEVSLLCDSILFEGKSALKSSPSPVKIIHYEGLLNTNPLRIKTSESLKDMDVLTNLIYSGYLESNEQIGKKVNEFVMAWALVYQPDGNPINENKFVALIWAYHLYHDFFSEVERQKVDQWLTEIATREMNRNNTPNNNWQAKRLKLIGLIGCLLDDDIMKQFSINGFREYINSSYFADGTSNDLKQRDALSYHLSGLKPCISAFINLSDFDSSFNLYNYEGIDGGSVKKSINYAIPYATGEKQHKEWVHSKVKLDHKRAAAGIEEYQPGIIFDPKKAIEAFEWAGYYDNSLLEIVDQVDYLKKHWIALLNSPLIRE